ncbi:transmembrane protein 168-like [Saccoglossus kowalevskii]|uniref:Transmembrane protein 168 n=1 Tax=Saccoglossus kowalevskii TaxID=10224 RepID=A0ABM0GXI0_SACKO|nr:PREDICTED: transmembrane protein 168-like [Saccoglossus kowalevskii]
MISFKYFTSHCLHIPVNKMMEVHRQCNVRYISHLSSLVLLIGICAGLYNRWLHSQDTMLLVLTACGLFLFALCGIFYYYFGLEGVSTCFFNLWCGCLLGMITYTKYEEFQYEISETIMNIMLMTSLGLKCFWVLIERICGLMTYRSILLTNMEAFELIGFAVASVILQDDIVAVWLLVLSYALTLIALRLRVLLAIPTLAVACTITAVFLFPAIHIPPNPFALSCFAGRLAIDSILDTYFCSLSLLERWQCYLYTNRFLSILSVFLIIVLEIAFFVFAGQVMVSHEEWYFSIPFFILFGLLWLCFHSAQIFTWWSFLSKIYESLNIYKSMTKEAKSMSRIMSSKGLRYFCLISQRFICFSFVTTLMLTAVSWQKDNAIFLSLFLIVLPIECMQLGLLYELGKSLGGTCIGYALVAPSNFCRLDGETVILPANAIQEHSVRSTEILNTMQRFFLHHMIDIFSCDYSTSGLTLDTVEAKLKGLFDKMTKDGPRYDTYVVFYSGHVQPNGDWALAGDVSLKFETLVEWWNEACADSGSRLIIVMDTKYSQGWIKQARRDRESYIAVQSFITEKSTDPETGTSINIGDFTSEWVDYNCSSETDVNWSQQGRVVRASYGVSRRWSDFSFHSPTEQDIESHWQNSFPSITRPFIKVLSIPGNTNIFGCCDPCIRCVKRCKMKWLSPLVIDTGHGFKLVRS